MISAYARNAIVLGLLAAIGPFAIDMYLPALPTIAADLNTTTAATQMTLMAFFVGFGLSPDRLWPGLRHGRPQAAALFRAAPVHRRRGRLRACRRASAG